LGIERVRHEARDAFLRSVAGTDLIVGARAHPVQLLLYSVFRLGEPTANLQWDTYEKLKALPPVAWTVPISLGDSHRGYRVVGTTAEYFARMGFGEQR
ncbi:MAG TPA: peptide ABC transporter permease, partial [Xanthomonadaceae bacterium]|nr:peptide ABC transporter permease [Xanthomonadaceae bacterium]